VPGPVSGNRRVTIGTEAFPISHPTPLTFAGALVAVATLRGSTRPPLHCLVQIPVSLQPHPELWRRFQHSREPKRRVRSNAPLSEHNLVQSVERNAEPFRRLKLSEAERLQVLF
jgi:hypothetical protein